MTEPRNVGLLIAAVKKHALDHYNEDGWDYVVECFSDGEIWKTIVEHSPQCLAEEITEREAIAAVGNVAQLLDDRRRDIQSTAF